MSLSTEKTQNRVENLSTSLETHRYLAREFLTWLWYLIETEEAPYRFNKVRQEFETADSDLELWIDDRIVLENPSSKAHENVIRGGNPSESIEASAALLSGKTVKEMKLGLRLSDIGEFTCVLNSDGLNVKSVKLPDITPEDQVEGSAISHRLTNLQHFLNVIDGLFQRFMDERTDKKWSDNGLANLRDWIKNKQSQFRNETLH